jgi:hypothetical protein
MSKNAFPITATHNWLAHQRIVLTTLRSISRRTEAVCRKMPQVGKFAYAKTCSSGVWKVWSARN